METIQPITTTQNDKAKLFEAQKNKKAADQLEEYFVHQMITEMRKTVPKDGILDGDKFSSSIYYDMLDEQMSQQIVQSGGFGYSKQILKSLEKNGSASINKALLDQHYKGGMNPDLRWN
jgi:flagellar protein FlgJ